MNDVVEQAGRIEHLEARLEADPEAIGRGADFDRAERHALHHRRKLAELVGRIDFDLDLPPARCFDAGFDLLVSTRAVTSLIVGCDSFMVNCCAAAGAAARAAATVIALSANIRPIVACMTEFLPGLGSKTADRR